MRADRTGTLCRSLGLLILSISFGLHAQKPPTLEEVEKKIRQAQERVEAARRESARRAAEDARVAAAEKEKSRKARDRQQAIAETTPVNPDGIHTPGQEEVDLPVSPAILPQTERAPGENSKPDMENRVGLDDTVVSAGEKSASDTEKPSETVPVKPSAFPLTPELLSTRVSRETGEDTVWFQVRWRVQRRGRTTQIYYAAAGKLVVDCVPLKKRARLDWPVTLRPDGFRVDENDSGFIVSTEPESGFPARQFGGNVEYMTGVCTEPLRVRYEASNWIDFPVTKMTPPQFPPSVLRRGLSGTVSVRITVLSSGALEAVDVVSSSGVPELDAAAVSAVRGWEYVMSDGKKSIVFPITFSFR